MASARAPLLLLLLAAVVLAVAQAAPLSAAASKQQQTPTAAATATTPSPSVGATTQRVAPSVATRELPSIDSYSKMSTSELRESFLIEKVFAPGEILLTYTTSALDRLILGGAMPTADQPLELSIAAAPAPSSSSSSSLGTAVLDRRELAIFNIGPGNATVELRGKEGDDAPREFALGVEEVVYVPLGTQSVVMRAASSSSSNLAPKLFLASAPCRAAYPAALATPETANVLRLGAPETANVRALRQMIAPGVGPSSCQLMVGMTKLSPGSVLNTMPPHRHLRRSEAYLYFNLDEKSRVFHFLGRPEETRHLVAANEQIALSPPWSIHAGAGTSAYSFVWVMAGENQSFSDQDPVPTATLL